MSTVRNTHNANKSNKPLLTSAILSLLAAFFATLASTNPDRSDLGWLPTHHAMGTDTAHFGRPFNATHTAMVHSLCFGSYSPLLFIDQAPLLSDDGIATFGRMVLNHGANPLIQSPDVLASLNPNLHAKVTTRILGPFIRLSHPVGSRFWTILRPTESVQFMAVIADALTAGIVLILRQQNKSMWPVWVYASSARVLETS